MGSRMMHYGISALIGRKLGIRHMDDLLLGGIAPDVNKNMNEDKQATHFIEKNPDGSKCINYVRFCEKYRDRMNEPFYLGYLCHLISDDIWYERFYNPKVRGMPADAKKEFVKTGYLDYWRLNGVIARHYALRFGRHAVPDMSIEEIKGEFLPELLVQMENDFHYEEGIAAEPLELFSFEEVFRYMETSADECATFIRSL
ncbi:hypothetical protein [Paenibacillus hamazuiensis]|uniref:hypothetical protein n=1 Tax=Paenibacillus hamazuiensis TaxID=2936508 RepID=UPI00200C30A6|nr:hypothetical protein [Paenibacillus hamazuiensis]